VNPMDRLKQDLQDGPLTRNGFNEELRGRIEERLREGKAEERRKPSWFSRTAYGLAMLLLLSAAVWQLPNALKHNRTAGDTAVMKAGADLGNATMAAADTGINSAVLIGLRQDRERGGRSYASYRTILFAPEGDEVRKIAEGPGLLVPHGTKFWRVDTVAAIGGSGAKAGSAGADASAEGTVGESAAGVTGANSAGEAAGLLVMVPAESTAMPKAASDEAPAGIYEKVLFAGDEYVAVQQTVPTAGALRTMTWVKEIRQLQVERDPRLAGTSAEPHVALYVHGAEPAAVHESNAADARRLDNWMIVREPGAWVVAAAEEQPDGRVRVKPLPNKPGTDIVNDDFLTVSWDAVKSVQPAAADVFSSRTGDLAVAVTDRNLVAYAVKDGELTEPAVTVPLLPGEKVVMAQWALNQPDRIQYADIWKDVAGPLLNGGAEGK